MGNDDSIFVLNHEVKTALNGIIGYTQLLLKTNLTKKQKEYIENINSYSLTLLHNINNVLDYHRLLTGNIYNIKEDINIYSLIGEINNIIEHNLNDIKFNYCIESIIPTINVDKNKLIQIILNLLLSFLEANNNTYINLKLSIKDNKFVFKLKSDIKEDNLSFGKILRTEFDNITNKIYENNINLDLSICKMLSIFLEWELDFNFTETHRTYIISVPITLAKNLNMKVLIADDNINNVKLLKEILLDNIEKNNITCVYDGNEAINHLKNEEYDILFLDMNMPVVNGKIILEYIQNNDIDVETYVLSACDYSDYLECDKDYGIKKYIKKPYNIDEIKNIIINYNK